MKLICGLILKDFNINVIMSLVKVWKQDLESCESGLLEVLQAVIDQILDDGPILSKEPFKLLEFLFKKFDLPPASLSDIISPLCTNEVVPVNNRLTLVKLLKELKVEAGSVADLDSSMLASLYETQHEIQTILPEFKVEKADLENNNAKWKLFEKMVVKCSTANQLVDLYKLVQKWEGFEEETATNVDKNCLLMLAYKMLKIDTKGKDLLKLFYNVDDDNFPPTVSQLLVTYCSDIGNTNLMIKMVLQLRMETKYEQVFEVTSILL